MRIPRELYFVRKYEKITFSTALPGTFVAERGLRSLPPFKRVSVRPIQTPKNLILTPFFFAIRLRKIKTNPDELQKTISVFHQLLESGFNIYDPLQKKLSLADIIEKFSRYQARDDDDDFVPPLYSLEKVYPSKDDIEHLKQNYLVRMKKLSSSITIGLIKSPVQAKL